MPMQPFPATTHYSTIIRSQTQQFEQAACSGAALLKCFVPLQAYWFSYHMDGFISSVVRSFRYIRGQWHGSSLKSLTCVCNMPYFDSPPVRSQNGFFYIWMGWGIRRPELCFLTTLGVVVPPSHIQWERKLVVSGQRCSQLWSGREFSRGCFIMRAGERIHV